MLNVNGHKVGAYRIVRTAVGVFLIAVVAPFFVDCGFTEQSLFVGTGVLLFDYKLFQVLRTGKSDELQ